MDIMDNETNRQMETLEQTCQRILATLESSKARRTTPPPTAEKSSETRRRLWLDKWLRINATHPQLQALEKAVYQFCGDYAKSPRIGHRLLIYGENGTGKSHAARTIFHWARDIAMQIPCVKQEENIDDPSMENTGFGLATASMWNWTTMMNRMKNGEWQLIEDLFTPHMLIVDDIGADHDPSKLGVEKLYLLLERREFKWTVMTTNIHPDQWADKFDRRIQSRFLRSTKLIALDQVPDFNSL